MLERSFLDALKADPNDELARLAFADWLEEQDDPRGAFLRAEMDHFRAGAPVPFLRVCEMAARLDLGWLAEASLMAVAVRIAWTRVGKGFRSTRPEDGMTPWHEAEARLAEAFDDPLFVVPYDYALFQELFPGGWFREGGRGVERAIWGSEMVWQRTRYWYEEGGAAGPPWLSIGVPWSDHEEHFLSCSVPSPVFGHVVAAGDDTHVLDAQEADLSSTFLDYLRSL